MTNGKQALIEKVLKMRKLAEVGVDGERENAARLVEFLMEKYGITEAELDFLEAPIRHWFRYGKSPMAKRLMAQVIYAVMGNVPVYKPKKNMKLGVDCTKAEAIEISAMYGFYGPIMAKEMRIFYSAFLNKNHIFPSADKPQAPTS